MLLKILIIFPITLWVRPLAYTMLTGRPLSFWAFSDAKLQKKTDIHTIPSSLFYESHVFSLHMSEFKVSDDADSSILLVLWHIVLNGHILQDFQSAAGLNGTDSSKISVSMFSSNSKIQDCIPCDPPALPHSAWEDYALFSTYSLHHKVQVCTAREEVRHHRRKVKGSASL